MKQNVCSEQEAILARLPESMAHDLEAFLMMEPAWLPSPRQARTFYFEMMSVWLYEKKLKFGESRLWKYGSLGVFVRTMLLYISLSPLPRGQRRKLRRSLLIWLLLIGLVVFAASMVIAWGIGTLLYIMIRSLMRSRGLFWVIVLLVTGTGLGVKVALTWLEKLVVRSVWTRISLVLPVQTAASQAALAFQEYLQSAHPAPHPLQKFFQSV